MEPVSYTHLVWAGANDEHIALVISNDSGNTGASLTRENRGETRKSINCLLYTSDVYKRQTIRREQNVWMSPKGQYNVSERSEEKLC